MKNTYKNQKCPNCKGAGRYAETMGNPYGINCPMCDGRGVVERSKRSYKKKKYNPRRNTIRSFLLYTLAEGGEFNFLGDFTHKQYNKLIKDGYFEMHRGDIKERIYPYYTMRCNGTEDFDFILDELNHPEKRMIISGRVIR